ncbi:unnamed protein product [Parajaminaea phylloscopi]
MTLPACDSVLAREDFAPCFRNRYINTVLPLTGLALSAAVFAIQYAHSARKHAKMAAAVAQLDPAASSFHIGAGTRASAPAPGATSRPRERSSTNVFAAALAKILPWNAPRILGAAGSGAKSKAKDGTTDADGSPVSAATLAVFRTENAMVLNEVHSTPLHSLDEAQLRRKRRFDLAKRTADLLGAIALASMHAAGWVLSGQLSETAWAATWSYFAILGGFSLGTSHSLFTHKTAMFILYFFVAIVNLRSVLLDDERGPVLTLTALKLAVGTLLLGPTLFMPLDSKVPADIAAVHRTMQARTQFGEPTTAIPTPARRHSPPPSVSAGEGDADERQPLLADDPLSLEAAAAHADPVAEKERPLAPPEVRASLYERIFFSFVTPYMLKHYSEQFTLPAVPDLPPADKAASVVAAFRAGSSRHSTATGDSDSSPSSLLPSNKPLAWRLVVHFGGFLSLQFFWAALEAVFEISPAVGLRLVLSYIAERDAERAGAGKMTTPWHMGVLYVCFMGLGQCVCAICASQCLFIGRRICIRLRAILITEIISKSLRRSDIGGASKGKKGSEDGDESAEGDVGAKKAGDDDEGEDEDFLKNGGRATDGQVVNLVSVDVFKVSEICAYLHFLFPSTPISIAICLYLLYDLLGWSALIGFGCLVVMLPAQILVARFFVNLQKRLLEATDKRLNLTTEVLNCIKTVKFFAWEEAFADRLGKTRKQELRVLKQRSAAWLASAFFFIGTPVLVTVVTFAVHTQIFHKNLDAETAFTALALFNLLRMPMDALPDMIVQCLSALVSVRRIDAFLREAETLKYEQLLRDDQESTGDDHPVIGFQDATFVFKVDANEDEPPAFALRDLNLTFPEGKLSIIAGPVGCGKTCLLLSLLGETQRTAGRTFMPCPIARALEPVDPVTGLSETVAYVSQSAWLLGTTVRENILFGSPYNAQRYKAVLKACSLEPDLKILEYHDETEVGEKGTSLSGGQKARVALARALYSPAKYVLIDDALSAVDAHTAEHLYRNYLLGDLMKGRTCVLVTHAVTLVLPGAAYAVQLSNGRVVAAGPAAELAAQGVFDHETGGKSSTASNADSSAPETVVNDGDAHKKDKEKGDGKEDGGEAIIEEIDDAERRATEEADIKTRQEKKKLSDLEEGYGKGSVGIEQYLLYIRSFYNSRWATTLYWTGALGLLILSRLTDVGLSASLRNWAASYSAAPEREVADAFALSGRMAPNVSGWTFPGAQTRQFIIPPPSAWFTTLSEKVASMHGSYLAEDPTHSTSSPQVILTDVESAHEAWAADQSMHYLQLYAAWAFVFIVISLTRDLALLFGALRSSRNLYDRMTKAILRARPQFFDRTPVGRIMNRFSKDLETVDQEMAPTFLFLIDVFLQGVVILVVSSYTLPPMLGFSVVVVIIYGLIGAVYIVSSRDLKRIESVQRSPIFTLVGEVLGGAVAIRAYGDAARFTRHCLRLIDKSSRPFFFLWYENRWLSMRVDTFAGIVSLGVGLGLIWRQDIDAALAGFTLSFTIQLVDAALWTVRMLTENEINFNSIERIGEYLNIEAEKSIGQEPPAHWPTASGSIVVDGLTVRYAPEFEPVLKGVSFEVKPGEKVGIVGRTGSGKSTLALCFFRFLEAEAGSISIDGISIAGVPLKTLRQRLTVIPQDAQLFSGTVRSNLDPFNQYEDGELWLALQRVKLASSSSGTPAASRAPTRPPSPTATAGGEGEGEGEGEAPELPSLFTSLEAPIEQGGRNLSSGQRQLVALARGLLKMRDSRILILDESTANLDSASDRQIQRTIRTEMAPGATLLVIAHRLRTIIDFDKILVLDKGTVLEYDSPMALLEREDSSFRELCERSGEMAMLKDLARQAAAKGA